MNNNETGADLPPPPGLPPPPTPAPQSLPGPPLDVGGMLDWAFRSLVRHARTFAAIVLILRAPAMVIGLLIGLRAAATSGNLVGTTFVFDSDTSSSGVIGAAAFLALLDVVVLTPAFLAAANRAAVEAYLGGAPDGGASIKFGLRRFASILLINVLVILMLTAVILPVLVIPTTIAAAFTDDASSGLGASVLVLVGVVAVVSLVLISVRMIFAPMIFVAEGRRGREALRRSWRLSKGHFWRIFGVFLLAAFLSSVATYAINTITSSIDSGGDIAAAILAALGAVLAQLIVAPFTILLMTALFFSVRASTEPLDLGAGLSDLLQRDPA